MKILLCGYKDVDEFNSQNEWNYQIAEIQQKQQKTKRQQSLTSSDNFSSSRSDSIKHGHCMPLRFVVNHPRRRNSWTVTRKTSQDSTLSSSRNDSAASNSTQSTNTWRMSHSSVSSELSNSIGRTGSGYSERSGNGGKFEALARAQALHRQGSRGTSPLAAGASGIIKQNSSTLMVRGKPRLIRQVAIQDMESNGSGGSGGTVAKQVSFKDNPCNPCPAHQHQSDKSYAERFRSLYAKLTESSHEEEETEKQSGDKTEAQPTLNLVTITGENTRPIYDGEKPNIRRSMENLGSPQGGRRVSLGTGLLSRESLDKQIKHGSSLTNLKGLAEPKYGPQKCTSENALLALQSKYGYSFKSAVSGSGVSKVLHSRSENVLVDKAEEGNTEERTNLLAPKEGNERTPNSSLSAREISQPSPVGSDRRTPVIEEEPEESDKLL